MPLKVIRRYAAAAISATDMPPPRRFITLMSLSPRCRHAAAFTTLIAAAAYYFARHRGRCFLPAPAMSLMFY